MLRAKRADSGVCMLVTVGVIAQVIECVGVKGQEGGCVCVGHSWCESAGSLVCVLVTVGVKVLVV